MSGFPCFEMEVMFKVPSGLTFRAYETNSRLYFASRKAAEPRDWRHTAWEFPPFVRSPSRDRKPGNEAERVARLLLK